MKAITHFIAKQILALRLAVYTEGQVTVFIGREYDFEIDLGGGDFFAIFGLVKQNCAHFFINEMSYFKTISHSIEGENMGTHN